MFVFQILREPVTRDDKLEKIDNVVASLDSKNFAQAQKEIKELKSIAPELKKQLERLPDLSKRENQSGDKIDTLRAGLWKLQEKLQEAGNDSGAVRGSKDRSRVPMQLTPEPQNVEQEDLGHLMRQREAYISATQPPPKESWIKRTYKKAKEKLSKKTHIPKEGDADFIGPLQQKTTEPPKAEQEDLKHLMRQREAYVKSQTPPVQEQKEPVDIGKFWGKDKILEKLSRKPPEEPVVPFRRPGEDSDYDTQVREDAKAEERRQQRTGPVRFPEGEPEPISFRTIIEDRRKSLLEKLKAPTTPKKVDERALSSLAMDAFDPGVEAAVKSFNSKLITKERVQQELTSTIIYLNKFLVVDAETAKKIDAKTNIEMLRTANFIEARMRTAVELALVSSWIGATKTRDFIKSLAADGYTFNENGEFVKNGAKANLQDLLKNESYTTHIPKGWLAKPLAALAEFEKLSLAPTPEVRQEKLKPLSEVPISRSELIYEMSGVRRGATSQLGDRINKLTPEQFALLSVEFDRARRAAPFPAEFENMLKEIEGMRTGLGAEYLALRLREEGYNVKVPETGAKKEEKK